MSDLLTRRKTNFVLWQPSGKTAPELILATFIPGNPPTYSKASKFPLLQGSEPGLWELPVTSLVDVPDGIYHYWFEVKDTSPNNQGTIHCTDPFAFTVEYRRLSEPGNQPAGVIKLEKGQLLPCDPGGEVSNIGQPPAIDKLPANNQLVIYEMPTSWSRIGIDNSIFMDCDAGTFQDVQALLDKNSPAANFSDLDEVNKGEILADLGINALELLPPADTRASRDWGYSTSNYNAPDNDLGFPYGNQTPTANSDLTSLVKKCHEKNIRFFADDVMAFGHDSYININYPEFHLRPKDEPDNPDSYQSNRYAEKWEDNLRAGFGGESWRYVKEFNTYDPESGIAKYINPASKFQLIQLERWMHDFHIDGIRIDSVNNIANYKFIKNFYSCTKAHFQSRYPGASQHEIDSRFLVIGEELNVPVEHLYETDDKKLFVNALWNEHFQRRVKASIIGESAKDENFEMTIRKMIDCCKYLGFKDGAHAINYITSHDTEGERKERLYNLLDKCGLKDTDKESRAKLAFVCLLTAVGIPMIFAGEEFCDQQDLPAVHPLKQLDPVNYSRKKDQWRTNLFNYVANLVRFREKSPALGVNDTEFIHFDFDFGRRIAAWKRGRPGIDDPVVVVANFSDQTTPGPEYIVNNWPAVPKGKKWREITQSRPVPPDWIGKEPLYPWEAKVYEAY